jgi:hypothetical protein
VLREHQEPAVPRPTDRIDRSADARAHNRNGCVIGSAEYKQSKARKAAAVIGAAAKKAATERAFWERHRPAVKAAELALQADPTLAQKQTQVTLKSLVISRSGHTAKAKNNTDLLVEVRGLLKADGSKSLLPPTPPRATAAESAESSADIDVDDGTVECGNCGLEQSRKEPDENGHTWCSSCQAGLDI